MWQLCTCLLRMQGVVQHTYDCHDCMLLQAMAAQAWGQRGVVVKAATAGLQSTWVQHFPLVMLVTPTEQE
jgi:hypothetical protein